jgi:hypothetical protein
MKSTTTVQRFTVAAALAATLLLQACGGGSNSNPPAPSPLSSTQQTYESFALAQNGGTHLLHGLVSVGNAASATVINPSSYLYTDDSALPASPGLTGTVALTTGKTSRDSHLAVPVLAGQRYLVNGVVMQQTVPETATVTYTGGAVEENYLASDGKSVVQTLLGTSYAVVALTGMLSQSPSELINGSAVGFLTNVVNGKPLANMSATWQPGSAYMRVTRHFVNDTVLTDDCLSPLATHTTGTTLVACNTTASTLATFFPHNDETDGQTYNLSDGQIVTLAGTTAWVSNAAFQSQINMSTSFDNQIVQTTQYKVYYESNGRIYCGTLIRAGTTLANESNTSPPLNSEYFFLNSAAAQTLGAAVMF